MSSRQPLIIGVAGVAGYARSVAETLRRCGPMTDPVVRLGAVCDPHLEQHAERVAELTSAGVRTHSSFEEMLDDERIEAVWLPLPIALHEPFTCQALGAGKPVMCEKPAAGTVDEVDTMIAARQRAGLPVLVGFQAIYDPVTAEVKRRLAEGAIGRIERASVYGCWPRSTHYFARTNWAGRIRKGGRWVLDSPMQNAMAHYVNLPLFLLGPEPMESAAPVAIEAELYRAAPIQNYDTVSARVSVQCGEGEPVPMMVLLTHACAGAPVGPWVSIQGERGSVSWGARTGAQIEIDGEVQALPTQHEMRCHMVQALAHTVRGESVAPMAVSTLESARAHTLVVNGASEAAPVAALPESEIERVTGDQGEVYHTIPDVARTFERCAASGTMLDESGAYAFTRPGESLDLRGYDHFAGPHAETLAAAPSPTPPS